MYTQTNYPPTTIYRHRKENLKKCSLSGLEQRCDFLFLSYPITQPQDFTGYLMLAMDAPVLSLEDHSFGLILLDATWRYAKQMDQQAIFNSVPRRSLPPTIRTAYPRIQTDCPNPEEGLASIEAIFAAYHILKRPTFGLLNNYYWQKQFLNKNKNLFL